MEAEKGSEYGSASRCSQLWKESAMRFRGGSRLGFKLKVGPPRGTGTMQDHAGRKGVKGLSLAGPKEVPRGFGLRIGDCGNTADSAVNCGRPAQPSMDCWGEPGEVSCRLLFFFFWRTAVLIGPFCDGPDWAKGEGRTVCVGGCFKRTLKFNGDILPFKPVFF